MLSDIIRIVGQDSAFVGHFIGASIYFSWRLVALCGHFSDTLAQAKSVCSAPCCNASSASIGHNQPDNRHYRNPANRQVLSTLLSKVVLAKLGLG